MSLISLGSLILEGFEVPCRVEFGGKQRLIVHKLLGGARVIDALGRDDAALTWRGVLSGAGASERARTLDAMRVGGTMQFLTWDVFCYSVVISDLRLSYCNPWWIPYEITCTVQQDLAQGMMASDPTFANSIINDLTQVSQFLGSSLTAQSQTISAQMSSGTMGQQQLMLSTKQLQDTIADGIANASSGLTSNDLAGLVSSAGSLAQLCCAQGYLDRSAANIIDMGV